MYPLFLSQSFYQTHRAQSKKKEEKKKNPENAFIRVQSQRVANIFHNNSCPYVRHGLCIRQLQHPHYLCASPGPYFFSLSLSLSLSLEFTFTDLQFANSFTPFLLALCALGFRCSISTGFRNSQTAMTR